ncbi:hypothetical protein U9M48_040347 [Paspalum notatum var. saurae]|uniref:Uncharacterized protein n=1 Tax=Paspalum notatum var. saurae TaxID=547442 RepID=A0AAQ3UQB7_PASNO
MSSARSAVASPFSVAFARCPRLPALAHGAAVAWLHHPQRCAVANGFGVCTSLEHMLLQFNSVLIYLIQMRMLLDFQRHFAGCVVEPSRVEFIRVSQAGWEGGRPPPSRRPQGRTPQPLPVPLSSPMPPLSPTDAVPSSPRTSLLRLAEPKGRMPSIAAQVL